MAPQTGSVCASFRAAAEILLLPANFDLLKSTTRSSHQSDGAPVPTFSTLLQLGSADMIAFYDKIRETAELFSVAYGEEYHQKLMQVL